MNFTKKYVALDLEWDEDKNIECFSVAYRKDDSKYFAKAWMYDETSIDILGNAINESVGVIFHNAKGDLKVLEKNGFDVETIRGKVHDTMLMAHIVDEFRRKTLKERCKDVGMELSSYDEAKGGTQEEFLEYNKDDSLATIKLFYLYGGTMKRDDLFVVYELERQCLYPTMRMEQTGMYIDQDKTKDFAERATKAIDKVKNKLYKLNGDIFNPGSTQQLAVFLFKTLGLKVEKHWKTAKGNISTNEKVLSELYDREKKAKNKPLLPAIEGILELRRLGKIVSTYVGDAILKQVSLDGRVHANFMQTGTATGRFSCSKPNLQNQPTGELFELKNEDTRIRTQYIPTPDWKMMVIDYSQIELRLLAYISQDASMLKVYADGGDLHQEMAEYADCSRDHAKSLNFGMSYGMSYKTFAAGTGVSLSKAKKLYEAHEERFPRVYKFFNEVRDLLDEKGYSITITGRRRRLGQMAWSTKFWERASAQRQAVNSTIQGSAGDLIKMAMVKIYNTLPLDKVRMVAQIHDELVLEIKDEKYAEKVKKCFETVLKTKSIQFLGDAAIVENWAQGKDK